MSAINLLFNQYFCLIFTSFVLIAAYKLSNLYADARYKISHLRSQFLEGTLKKNYDKKIEQNSTPRRIQQSMGTIL